MNYKRRKDQVSEVLRLLCCLFLYFDYISNGMGYGYAVA